MDKAQRVQRFLSIVFLVLTPAVAASQVAPAATNTVTEVGYFIGTGRPADSFRASDPELATWALEAWQRAIGPSIRFVPVKEEDALIRLYWVGPLGGQYGEMRPFTVGARTGAALFIRPAVDALGADIARRAAQDPLFRDTIVYLTCVHEIGHALGLRHTSDFRDIMYFFGYGGDIVAFFQRYREGLKNRSDIAHASGLSDADVRTVRDRFFRN